MFELNEKHFIDGCIHDHPNHPPKPAYTVQEEMMRSTVEMKETIGRMIQFEHRLTEKVDDMLKHLTSDNVIFKNTFTEAYNKFISDVKNEVNVFEGTTNNAWSLFKSTIENAYAQLDEECKAQITAYYNDVIMYIKNNINDALTSIMEQMQADGSLNGVIQSHLFVTPQMCGAMADGETDDTLAIQSAIDFVHGKGGGVVVIPRSDAEYIFTSIEVKENVTLRGMGGVLKFKGGVCVNSNTEYYLIYNNEANNVTIEDLIVDGNSANNSVFKVADIITVGGNNVTVRNCTLRNAPDSGIMFSCVESSKCINNTISGCRDAGIYINNNGQTERIMASICSGNVITNCGGGISLKRNCQYMTLTNNIIKDCQEGISLLPASTNEDTSHDIVIEGNIVYNALSGLRLKNAHHCTVNSNYLTNCKFSIRCEGVEHSVITNNNIKVDVTVLDRTCNIIEMLYNTTLGTVCKNVVLSNNVAEVNIGNKAGYEMNGIVVQGISTEIPAANIIIEGNNFSGVIQTALSMKNVKKSKVKNNIASGTAYACNIVTSSLVEYGENSFDGAVGFNSGLVLYATLPDGCRVFYSPSDTTPTQTADVRANDMCFRSTKIGVGVVYIFNGTEWVVHGVEKS